MEKDEIKKLSSILSETLGNQLEFDIEKFMFSVYENQELNIGIRDGYKLTIRKVTFTSLVVLKDEDSVENDKYKPEHLLPNENDYYFASEEIARFNSRDAFFGIIGSKWFDNGLGDEFAEAIVFGKHNLTSIDCMLGSVRVNKPYEIQFYLAPGTLVTLKKVEFKNTKYLEVATFLPSIFVNDNSETRWNFGDFQGVFYWDGQNYTTEPIYSGGRNEYYDEDANNDDGLGYNDWLRSEFGDDAETAYWNTQ